MKAYHFLTESFCQLGNERRDAGDITQMVINTEATLTLLCTRLSHFLLRKMVTVHAASFQNEHAMYPYSFASTLGKIGLILLYFHTSKE